MNRSLVIGGLVAITTVGCGDGDSPGAGQNPDVSGSGSEPAVALSTAAVAQIKSLLEEKEARAPAERKISSQLLYALKGMPFEQSPTAARLESATQSDDAGRALVDVKAEVTPALLDEFQLFLAQNRIQPGISEWSGERAFIRNRLKTEIFNQAIGIEKGDEVEAQRDPQIQKALEAIGVK